MELPTRVPFGSRVRAYLWLSLLYNVPVPVYTCTYTGTVYPGYSGILEFGFEGVKIGIPRNSLGIPTRADPDPVIQSGETL